MESLDLVNTNYNNKMTQGQTLSASGLFSNYIGNLMQYSQLRISANNALIQANTVELQAKQQANQLREQFINSVGNYQYGAARRGISVQSGVVKNNIERSSIGLGQDIQTMQENAGMQANVLRTQAKMQKSQAKFGNYYDTALTAYKIGSLF